MAHDLVHVITLSLLSSLYAWLAYKGGLFLRREQRFHENLRIVYWLGVSTIVSVLGLGPFFPAIMAILVWRGHATFILDWRGWMGVTVTGLLLFLWGLFRGKVYLDRYRETFASVTREEIVPKGAEFPYLEFGKFEECLADLIFQGVDSRIALDAARSYWKYRRN